MQAGAGRGLITVPFNSFMFLLGFLPFALGGYALACRAGPGSAKTWLIVVSVLFYGTSAPRFLPLLLISVCANLLLLQAMRTTTHAGRLACIGVVLNLALLGWFKYIAPGVWADPVLPLGISFFTFTQIGCLLAQAASDEPPPRAENYALFVLFFPTLTAGPILNAREMLPQFARTEGWRLSRENLATGAGFFIIGLLKKTLLADPLYDQVCAGFADPAALTLLPAWQTATAWSLQLYFDFSGYTDMAIGLGWMFGFRFPDNFDQPYRARSAIEYWQRWHMSLTRFLVTNVHAPLTLAFMRRRRALGLPINQAAQKTAGGFLSMIAAPIVLTMILIGVWHGPALTFLLFGVLHSGFLLTNHAWRLWRAPAVPPLAGVALTYLSMLVGAVVFRAASVSDAGALLGGMAGWHGLRLPTSDVPGAEIRGVVEVLWIVGLYAIVWLAPTTRHLMRGSLMPGGLPPSSLIPGGAMPGGAMSGGAMPGGPMGNGMASRLAWRPTRRWAIVMGCGATLGLLASGGAGEFVYFHF